MKPKPCPFCGSEAQYTGECDMVWIKCSDDNCQAQRIWKFEDPETAVENWNGRAGDEITTLRADKDRLAAQVGSQRAEIDELRKSIPPLLLERDQLTGELEDWIRRANEEMTKRIGLIEEMTKYADRFLVARRQRDAYRGWADLLACLLSNYNGDDSTLLSYRLWRNDPTRSGKGPENG